METAVIDNQERLVCGDTKPGPPGKNWVCVLPAHQNNKHYYKTFETRT